ncbi:MAG: signal transduction histidine kinase [Maribacter sp.]|jgi:signal transduction histidine kinase
MTPNYKIANQILVLLFMALSCFTYSQKKNANELKREIKELKNTSDFVPEDKHYIDLLLELAHWLKYSKTDTVKFLAIKTLNLSEKINYEKGKVQSLLNFGYYELFNGNSDKAIYYYYKNLDNSVISNYPSLAIEAYNGIAQAHYIKAEYPAAYTSFLKSLEIAEKTNDLEMVIKMNTNLGTMFSLLQDYDDALIYYSEAQAKFNSNTSKLTKVFVSVNLGYLYSKTEEYEKAIDYLTQSVAISEKQEAVKVLAFAYLTLGEVYNQTKEYKKAILYFDKANSIYKTINDKKGEADLYYATGMSHFNLNELVIAEKYFSKSLELYTSFSLKTGIEKCYKALYSLNKKKGFDAESLYNLELAQKYGDSVEKEKKKRDISMLKTKLSFEKNKADLTEQNQLRVDNQKKQVKWITVGLMVAIVMAFLVFRVNRTKRKLNQKLTLQTTILSNKQKELNNINNNQDKLFSIVGHDLRVPILSLKQLLGTALEKDKEIQHFYTYGPKLKKDVDHIHFTLDNLLNWGLTQMKGDVTNPVSIAVKEVLLESEQFFKETLNKKNITVNNHIPDNLTLTVDSNHFIIIFRNLLSNAIKFTLANGKIFIDSYTEKNTITIRIKDTGIGMSKALMDKIYRNTEHYTTLGTNNERGTGLGLILCKELIEKNKGYISVQSKLEEGSILSVHFITD